MIRTLQGWIILLLGNGVLIGADYLLRLRDGNMSTGELPEVIQIAILGSSFTLWVWFLYIGVKPLNIWLRALVIAAQVPIAGFILFWVSLMYICSAGIDCL